MKFYLASSFELIEIVKDVANKLVELGHIVTVEWWHKDFKKLCLPEKNWYKNKRVVDISQKNFRGIEEAGIFILISHPTVPRKFNGANIELGYALALKKDCYSLGKLERSAMYVPITKYSSLSQILRRVEE